MAPKAVPLMSKCAASAWQIPSGQESVMVTVTGLLEQSLLPVHLTCIFGTSLIKKVKNGISEAKLWSVEMHVYTDLVARAASFAVLEQGIAAGGNHRRERALAGCALVAARAASTKK
jgi:hypothetical protein